MQWVAVPGGSKIKLKTWFKNNKTRALKITSRDHSYKTIQRFNESKIINYRDIVRSKSNK